MKWLRTIDSAQRQVVVETPQILENLRFTRLIFHIQGVTAFEGHQPWENRYVDMVQHGIDMGAARPLSIWQRLLRKEAMVGEAHVMNGNTSLNLWSKPELRLNFKLKNPPEAELYRECEIMILSAGFHFREL